VETSYDHCKDDGKVTMTFPVIGILLVGVMFNIMGAVELTKLGVNDIEQNENKPYYKVTVATPVKLEDKSLPIFITNVPVVMAGEGFSTLSNIIVTVAIAEAVVIALLMTKVYKPLKDTEILWVTSALLIINELTEGSCELLSTYYEGNII